MAPNGKNQKRNSKAAESSFGSLDNLTENENEERNWKSIAVALLVIAIICTLIVVAIIFTAQKVDVVHYGRPMTFEDVYNSSFQTYDIKPQWVGDVLCYRARNGDLMSIDPATNEKKVLLESNFFSNVGPTAASDYVVSPNLKYVALKWRVTPKFRHSGEAYYTVYDVQTKNRMNIVPSGFRQTDEVALQLFLWTTVNQSDALVFAYRNNLYYKATAFADESTQITFSGVENRVFNGLPDWLYEEEIIASASALWWSRNGSIIAYAEFNDSQCSFFEMARYKDASQIYPVTEYIPYPKAGEQRDNNIPVVTIHLHNVDTNSQITSFTAPPEFLSNTNYIFTAAAWFDDNSILIEWTNRIQTKAITLICSINTNTCVQSLLIESISITDEATSTTLTGWVDASNRRFFPVAPVGTQRYPFITTSLHTTQSPRQQDVYRQVSFVGGVARSGGGLPRVTPLSSGSEVDAIIAVDSVQRIAYYMAPRDDDAKTAHLFAASWTDSGEGANQGSVRCLTCSMNETCDVVSARFSASARYYLLYCSGPAIPMTVIKSTLTAEEIVMEENKPLENMLQGVMMPRVVYKEIEIDGGRKVDVELMLPPALNEMHHIAHPLLVYVYAGPESRGVMKRWKSIGWLHHLVTERNIIVATIDGRGTGGRGRKNAYWLYKSLGTHEIRDQILAIDALRKYPYVDNAKIAVQGASYGGYATLLLLANASDLIPCGISLAPVTDWAFYDTAYTERFMGLYGDNLLGYNRASVLQSDKIEGLKKGILLLAHGTADDNVHAQQTFQLLKLLNDAGAQYDLQIYTDMGHNLRAGASGKQLTQKMVNFLLDCYNNKTAARAPPEDYSKFEDEADS